MITKNNLSSIGLNIGTFISTFITSLFIVRKIGDTTFYSDFLVFTAFTGTFLFLAGSLKESILYSNKDNPNFLQSLRYIIFKNRKWVVICTLLLLLSMFSFVSYFIPDTFISFILCSHILAFYLSESIQFTSVITNQVDQVIHFRFMTSIVVLFLTWLGLNNNYYLVIYISLLINTLLPLILFLRLNKQSILEGHDEKINFNWILFFIISVQYFFSSIFTFTERYFMQKSAVDLNSYTISLGLVQNLSAVFLSYVTIKVYSIFIKNRYDESLILRYSAYIVILLLPICLTVSLQNEPFINLIYGSKNNSEIFISNISSSIIITIWAIPALAISTIIARYLMSINKIRLVIMSSIIVTPVGILAILIIYYFFDQNYLRYCWMISQNLTLGVILILGLKQSFSIHSFTKILSPLLLTTIICLGTSKVFETQNLVFNFLEMILTLILLLSCIWLFKRKALKNFYKKNKGWRSLQ